MKSVLLNLIANYCISWFVTRLTLVKMSRLPVRQLSTLKEVMRMTTKIKSLLTRAQQMVLRKAAELLVADDEFDGYFFKLLAIRKGLDSTSKAVVPIGSNYAVVKLFDTGRKQCVEVNEL